VLRNSSLERQVGRRLGVAWEQGQHVAIVGDTGSGKTYLEALLLRMRSYNIVLRTKDDDIRWPGFKRVRRVDQIEILPRERQKWYILDPTYRAQAGQAHRLVARVWAEGGWTVTFDELFYLENRLGATSGIEMLLTQGRSNGITVVCGMQRPSRVSRFALSQCTHLFAFASEGRDVATLAEAFTPKLKEIVPNLREYQFAYFNRRTRLVQVGRAQQLGAVLA